MATPTVAAASAGASLTPHYDAVFVENLNIRGMLESPENARNKAKVGTLFRLVDAMRRRTIETTRLQFPTWHR